MLDFLKSRKSGPGERLLLHLLLLALFTVIVYWPLSSLYYTTRWDSIDGYYPCRYFISDCLRDGRLPLWLPYQLGGYPFYADPQSGAWYPFAWISGLTGPYSLSRYATEYILSFFLGGTGMYLLCRSFGLRPLTALLSGMVYIACGFYVSNAEHLSWVVSATWIPWVFWAYHRTKLSGKAGYAILSGVFLFLLISGGYPAFITITLYLLILFFLASQLRRMPAAGRLRMIGIHALMAGVFLIMSAGLLLSWAQSMPLMSRGAGLTLEQTYPQPFSPRCLESLLLPFVTLRGEDLYLTDISMRNAYIGLFALVALPLGIWRARSPKLWLILLLAVFMLAAALGPYLPVRAWLYHGVPLMKLFRFPALFRLFFLIGIILVSAHGLDAVLKNVKNARRVLSAGLLLTGTVLAVILTRSIGKHGFSFNWGISSGSFRDNLLVAPRHEFVQLQTLIQLGVIAAALAVLLLRLRTPGRFRTLFAFVLCGDLVLATWLNAFGTIVSPISASEQEAPVAAAPHHFIIPDNTVPVRSFNDTSRHFGLIHANTSVYLKTPAADGYNTFLLNNFLSLDSSAIREQVRSQPYLYAADALVQEPHAGPLPSATTALLNRSRHPASPKLAPAKSVRIDVTEFGPGSVRARVQAPAPTILVLQQNSVPGWRARIDGHPADIIPVNYAQMAVQLPGGMHLIEFRFDPPYIRAAYVFTITALLLTSGFLILGRRRLFRGSRLGTS